MTTTEDSVRGLVEPLLAEEGLVLDSLTIRQAGQRRLVQITVDADIDDLDDDTTPVAPLTLDEVADATRVVDEALEGSDVLGTAPYTLEVGSPGVSRPLTQARHYRRNVGRLVKATLADGSQVTGRIVRATADEVELLVAATKGKNKAPEHERTLALAELRSAAVQVEFNRKDAAIDLTDLPDADDADDTDDTDDTDDLDADEDVDVDGTDEKSEEH